MVNGLFKWRNYTQFSLLENWGKLKKPMIDLQKLKKLWHRNYRKLWNSQISGRKLCKSGHFWKKYETTKKLLCIKMAKKKKLLS